MSSIDIRLQKHAKGKEADQIGLADSALEGVTVSFLAQVFVMDPFKVKRALVNCPIKRTRKRGRTQTQHLYDLGTAAAYLVKPDIDVDELLKKIKPADLPPAINTAYWDAALKRQKWEENAGQLWRTETIRGCIGSMFQTIKFTIQLWGDTIERQTGLSEEQREVLNDMTDNLQGQIFSSLEENAAEAMTGPQLAELNDMLASVKEKIDVTKEEDGDVDDSINELL